MIFIDSPYIDPADNLALETWIFECNPYGDDSFLLWQNAPTVVIGRHQNALREVDLSIAKNLGIRIVRRKSGGGAVYQDMGNLNFTVMLRHQSATPNLRDIAAPILRAIASFGLSPEWSGRNDLCLGGKKFSGLAFRQSRDTFLLHGTLLYDVDLAVLSKVLTPSRGKTAKNGVMSVASRVTNLRPHLPKNTTLSDVKNAIITEIRKQYPSIDYIKCPKILNADLSPYRHFFMDDTWNFGICPEGNRHHTACTPIGELTISWTQQNNRIDSIIFTGDFFSEDTTPLANRLLGCEPTPEAVYKRLMDFPTKQVIPGCEPEEIANLFFKKNHNKR